MYTFTFTFINEVTFCILALQIFSMSFRLHVDQFSLFIDTIEVVDAAVAVAPLSFGFWKAFIPRKKVLPRPPEVPADAVEASRGSNRRRFPPRPAAAEARPGRIVQSSGTRESVKLQATVRSAGL